MLPGTPAYLEQMHEHMSRGNSGKQHLLKYLMHCLEGLPQCLALRYACLLNELFSDCELAFME